VSSQSLRNKELNKDSFSNLIMSETSARKVLGTSNPNRIIELVISILLEGKLSRKVEFKWVKHHDAHLGCALGASGLERTLLVSLDGEGDGESGVISLQENRKMSSRVTLMKDLDSLGLLYSAVTRRYDFKSGRHEGKITGLAAYGSYSQAVDLLLNAITICDGRLELKYAKSSIEKAALQLSRKVGMGRGKYMNISEIVDAAAQKTIFYPDLAHAVQEVLERSTLEIVEYWVGETEVVDISLAGGVFANVKLNQRIADLKHVRNVTIFPNMGDGGLSLGGIWHTLSQSNSLSKDKLYKDMYLGFDDLDSIKEFDGVIKTDLSTKEIEIFCGRELSKGKYIGLHQSKMEFGPRALGNRSILFDPRSRVLGPQLNRRLGRTEFMPFAPAILEDNFSDYMETGNGSLDPFYYMTMTCGVKEQFRDIIPAVVHVDGTARPQLVSRESNLFLYRIMEEFQGITSIPVLVNTSFNIHEEPINGILEDSINCLRRGVVDFVVTQSSVYSVVSIER
jgi:carbamoyltransferase